MFYKATATAYDRSNGEAIFFKTNIEEASSLTDFENKLKSGEITKYKVIYTPVLEADEGTLLPFTDGKWVPFSNSYIDLLWSVMEYETNTSTNGNPVGFFVTRRF